MYITTCQLVLHENLFYATREVGRLYETGRYLQNYGLTYALGLAVAPYYNGSAAPAYGEDFAALNAQGIYVLPAKPVAIGKENSTMTHALHAIVINLIAQEAGRLPGTVGELAHAAFYAAVNAVDPALAAQIHDAQERKAFSLSPLYGYWQSPQDGRIHVNAGQPGWLRLGLLDEELFTVGQCEQGAGININPVAGLQTMVIGV